MKTKKNNADQTKKIRNILYVVTFVVSFTVILGIFLGGIFLSAYWENIRAGFSGETWAYTLGLEEDEYYSTKNIGDDYLYRDGVLYLNMTDIAKMCNLTVVGDFNELTYFSTENNDQRVTFYYNSDKISVNGEHYKLNGIMFEREGSIYVPASFFDDSQFCSGVVIEIDEDNLTLEVYRHSLGIEYNPLDKPYHIYEEITFLTGSIQPIKLPDRGLMFSSQSQNNDDER